VRMRPFGTLIPWDEAWRRLVSAITPVDRTESVAVPHAGGRVAARSYRARAAVPPFDRATWDGYALRSRDTRSARSGGPVRCSLVGEVFAEGGASRPLARGQAVAIATGGALPPGADAVVAFEEARAEPGSILVDRPVHRGERIARAGEDIPRGGPVVEEGALLTPADLGALAITGTARVAVRARPVVTILPNGNELNPPGAALPPGGIYESNNATLSAVVEACGGIARPLPPVPDDPRRIESAIRKAQRASDLVLVTGGSSVGERDFLPAIFPRLGRLLFHGVAIRPGKPTLAVRTPRGVVVGLPGHPTSCLSNAFWLIVPALRKLAGLPGAAWRPVEVRLASAVSLPTAGFATVVPLAVAGRSARPTYRGSSAIASLGGANAFALWPADRRPPGRGARVTAYLLAPPLGPADPAVPALPQS
jgi:molybdenum cofactor synthesis domain-containing protein